MKNTAIIRRMLLVIATLLLTLHNLAQENTLQAGDPPLASQITVAEVDDLTVTVIGEAGSVFASAGVIVRNLYTGATATTIALGDGSFEVTVSGTEGMPYQVNAIQTLPQTVVEPLRGVGTIIYPDYDNLREGQPIPFAIGGQLAYGAAVWFGEGEINQLNFNAGDELSLTLNVRMFLADADTTLPYIMRGQIALRRLFDENGRQLSTAIGAGDDWSSELTPTGLPILGRHVPDTLIAEAETERLAVNDETGEVSFRLEFAATIPDELPAGIYVPVFTGYASLADSEPFNWYANRIFSTSGENNTSDSSTILGLPIRVGEIAQPEIVATILNTLPVLHFHTYGLSNELNHQRSDLLELGVTYNITPKLLGWYLLLPLPIAEVNNQSAQLIVEDKSVYLWYLDGDNSFEPEFFVFSGGVDTEISIRDVFGNTYQGGGEYHYSVIDEVVFYSSILSGTILETDSHSPIVGSVSPYTDLHGIRLNFGLPDTTFTINPYGYFHSIYIPFESEYLINWLISGDPHFFGVYTSSGVLVQPPSLVNGVMGLADYDRSPQAWFDTRSYPTDAPDIPAFVNFPYFQGDVVYVPDGADSGINPVLTGGDYQYLSIVRPDITVRQFIRDSGATFDARVSNDDLLGGQVGAGSEGNRPGDVMFLFGGTVDGDDIRGYSALAVVTDEDSARVVPPFTEPLFTMLDEPIYMFVLPTGVRPGQMLEVGNKFAHVGYVAPTVAADVFTEIITPSGEVIQNTTTASTFGYFYEQGHDFTVTEAGVYRVFTQASYNGITSAGQLNDTFTGHPLGAEEYFVFVVPEGEPMLTTPRESISEVASGQPFTINVRAPESWTDVTAYYVVRTASTILEQGTLDTFANQTNYQFNWSQISRTFPNIESAATEPSNMDEITFSFAMTGLDANGNPQIQARVFTLRGNTLYTFED